MYFIIGGSYQGKLEYVLREFSCDLDQVFFAEKEEYKKLETSKIKIVKDFHLLVRHWMQDDLNVLEKTTNLIKQMEDGYIISDEIGYGIVPIDAFERAYREKVGRMSCIIAKEAEHVIRIIAGMGNIIK